MKGLYSMDNKKWWKNLKPFRLDSNWTVKWNKLKDIEPDNIEQEDEAWLYTFVEDMTYLVKEDTYKENKKIITHTLAIDLGWYPDGDIKGNYRLIAILDNDWSNPILELKTRSTQEVADTIEQWVFETFTYTFWEEVRRGKYSQILSEK